MLKKTFTVYRVWYGNCIVYIGRTKQPLQDRIRGHVFSKPIHRKIDIEQVSKIEYAEFMSEADMNLYEIYYILKVKPPLNVDDKAPDELSVSLPEPEWKGFTTHLWDKWREEVKERERLCKSADEQLQILTEQIRILRGEKRMKHISEDEFFEKYEELSQQVDMIAKQRKNW